MKLFFTVLWILAAVDSYALESATKNETQDCLALNSSDDAVMISETVWEPDSEVDELDEAVSEERLEEY